MGKKDDLEAAEKARKVGELVGRTVHIAKRAVEMLEDHEKRIKALEKKYGISRES